MYYFSDKKKEDFIEIVSRDSLNLSTTYMLKKIRNKKLITNNAIKSLKNTLSSKKLLKLCLIQFYVK